MQNLAGVKFNSEIVKKELDQARIAYSIENHFAGEIKTNIIGLLPFNNNLIKFTRAWIYWCAHGLFSLDFVEKVYYASKEKKDIRAQGHIIFQEPSSLSWSYFDEAGRELFNKKELEEINKESKLYKDILKDPLLKFVDDPQKEGKAFIKNYHIDSQEGLNIFSQLIKEELKR